MMRRSRSEELLRCMKLSMGGLALSRSYPPRLEVPHRLLPRSPLDDLISSQRDEMPRQQMQVDSVELQSSLASSSRPEDSAIIEIQSSSQDEIVTLSPSPPRSDLSNPQHAVVPVEESTSSDGKRELTPEARIKIVIYIILVAGGVLAGYSSGVAGGNLGSDAFVRKFFPKIFHKATYSEENNLCPYSNQLLQFYVSILIIGQLLGFHGSTWLSVGRSRKPITFSQKLITSCVLLGIGVTIIGTTKEAALLLIGMAIIGCGLGITLQVIPIIIWDVAPTECKDMMDVTFDLSYGLGVIYINLCNLVESYHSEWQWYPSIIGYVVPWLILTCSSIYFSSMALNPPSIIRIPSFEIFSTYRRQLFVNALIQLLFQSTGVNALNVYLPLMMESIGYTQISSFMVDFVGSLISFVAMLVITIMRSKSGSNDRLFGGGCIFIMICQAVIGYVLSQEDVLVLPPQSDAYIIATFGAVFLVAYAGISGPKGFIAIHLPEEVSLTRSLVNRSCSWSIAILLQHLFIPLSCKTKGSLLYIFFSFTVVLCFFVLKQYRML